MFDIGFTQSITNTWTSVLWTITIIVHLIIAIGAPLFALGIYVRDQEVVLILLATPVAAVISFVLCRLSFELGIVLFRGESNTLEMKECLQEIASHVQAAREQSEQETGVVKQEPEV